MAEPKALGASDPDANGDFCKLVRLFGEGRGFGWVVPTLIGIARPLFDETIELIARARPERREQYLSFKLEGILDAPINVCVTCDRTRFGPAIIGRNTMYDTDIYSTCVAIQNLWLAARAEGVGVGWVSILKPEVIQQILGIPDRIVVVGYMCVGYPIEFAERPLLEAVGWLPRLSLSELVFSNRWNGAPGGELASALHHLDENAPDSMAKRSGTH